MSSTADLTQLVKQAAAEAGFELAAVAPVRNFPEFQYFSDWIADGRAGDMHYLEALDGTGNLKRASVQQLFPWARSVIVCAMNYNTAHPRSIDPALGPESGGQGFSRARERNSEERRTGNSSGWISRYAWSSRDYHAVVMERLRRVEGKLRAAVGENVETTCYVDTGPLLERLYARYSGIGWIGKNTCLINQRIGSWLFLGVILTSLPSRLGEQVRNAKAGAGPGAGLSFLGTAAPAPDRCGTCTRCLDACPTNAFLGPRQLDASRCISYLTIEKRGTIPEPLRADMGRHVFGCDICQDVCPWNHKAPFTTLPEFQPRPGLVNADLEWLATISEEEFRDVFRGSPIKRAKRSGLRRNAVIAMGNSGNAGFLPTLRKLAKDTDEVLAAHALWAIERLSLQTKELREEQ